MAQFRGYLRGSRGKVTRLGGKDSGVCIIANGWNAGVSVFAWHDEKTDRDEFRVYATGGSNVRVDRRHIATVIDDHKGLRGGPSVVLIGRNAKILRHH